MESTTHVIHGDVCNYRHALTKAGGEVEIVTLEYKNIQNISHDQQEAKRLLKTKNSIFGMQIWHCLDH